MVSCYFISYCIFLLKTTTNVIADHVMKMENVRTPQDHFHVPAMLDIQEMGIPAKVRYMHCFV